MSRAETSPITQLRDAAWLTRERARAYCIILALASLALPLAAIAMSQNGLDPLGKPLGTDFLSFWTASQIALQEGADRVYWFAAHQAAQRAAFEHAATGFFPFLYPPVFLLICLPFAALPYFLSLAVWLSTTFYFYWRVVLAFVDDTAGLWLAMLAFPAVLVNVGHGQNGFLTAALFGAAILVSEKRPVLAGILFGALVFKPQLAVLLPVALAAWGAWRTFFSAGLTALALVALSAMAFGLETWRSFFAAAPLARAILEQGLVEPGKLQSVFAAVRLFDGPLAAAYAAQAATAIVVCLLVARLARSGAAPLAQGAALAAGTLLATPYLLDYDLTLLAIPLAWLFNEGRRAGFLPWEKILLAAGFLLPLVSRLVAQAAGLPLGPPVLAAIFLLVLRRAAFPTAENSASPLRAPLAERARTCPGLDRALP